MISRYTVGLITVVLAAAAALLLPDECFAVCGNAVTFGQLDYNCGGNFCYVISPGAKAGNVVEGSFWSLTFGNPTTGLGNDNGTWTTSAGTSQESGWCRKSGPGCYMTGTWAQDAGIDGCIENQFAPGKSVEIQVTAFTDQSVNGATGFFAVASARRTPVTPEFDFTFVNGGGTATDINLVAIPKPVIVSSTRVSSNQTDVTVKGPDQASLSGGVYGDGSATFSDVIKGWKLFKKVLPEGSPAPNNRDKSSGWTAVSGRVDIGTNATDSTTGCASNQDIYYAVGLVFDSNFETKFLSGNSTVVKCGPTLAEPPRFKIIDKDKGKQGPIKPRTRR
jgi:hypothetical protein